MVIYEVQPADWVQNADCGGVMVSALDSGASSPN